MTIGDLFFGWLLPGLGLAFFAAGAWGNADTLFGWSKAMRAARAEGRHVSMALIVPGVIGAISMWNGPFAWMRTFFWVPLVLDVGCIPYFVLGWLAPRAPLDAEARTQEAQRAEADAAKQAAAREARSKVYFRAFAGCLLGTAVGDALGLACEGLSPQRQARLFPDRERYHLLPFGRGMCSDDTEHSIMVAQALIETAGYANALRNAQAFRANLAWRMRWWFLGLPAGIGMATLKGIIKLWLFLPQRWQGIYSAGNAPSMRSALIGVFWAEDPELLRLHVEASARLTHSDPRAAQAALAVAVAASLSSQNAGRVDASDYAERMRSLLGQEGAELAHLIDRVADSVRAAERTLNLARALGLERGVTGYAFHTVPVALHAWLAHLGDFRQALLAAIECGGDTDTVAAITGAIAGAGTGTEGIPRLWLARLAEWPHSVAWMRNLAQELAQVRVNYVGTSASSAPVSKVLLRNVFFILLVLLHGLRRMLPPY